jgi:phage host-nuclease inhibitor protein Gam
MVELLNLKRTEIRRLWQETSASSAQIAEFEAFGVNDEAAFTDALLEEHEAMVATLQQRLETMQPLLKLVKKYYEAVEARAQLVEFQKDKERLKGRGAAKQLKLEEQMGKKIKQMPKIIESLTKQVKEWEAANGGTSFCVPAAAPAAPEGGEQQPASEEATPSLVGRSILEIVEETESIFKAKKDGEMKDKKAAKDKERMSHATYNPGHRSSLLQNDDNAPPAGGSGKDPTRNGGKRGAGKKSSIAGGSSTATAALGEVSASRRNSDD